jgi:hypothetical protein
LLFHQISIRTNSAFRPSLNPIDTTLRSGRAVTQDASCQTTKKIPDIIHNFLPTATSRLNLNGALFFRL